MAFSPLSYEERHVTTVAKFLDDNNREFLQWRRRTANKTIGLDWQKINFARDHAFLSLMG